MRTDTIFKSLNIKPIKVPGIERKQAVFIASVGEREFDVFNEVNMENFEANKIPFSHYCIYTVIPEGEELVELLGKKYDFDPDVGGSYGELDHHMRSLYQELPEFDEEIYEKSNIEISYADRLSSSLNNYVKVVNYISLGREHFSGDYIRNIDEKELFNKRFELGFFDKMVKPTKILTTSILENKFLGENFFYYRNLDGTLKPAYVFGIHTMDKPSFYPGYEITKGGSVKDRDVFYDGLCEWAIAVQVIARACYKHLTGKDLLD